MKGELIINNQDAYEVWGVNMGEDFISAIMEPPPIKKFISNESRLEHGKRYVTSLPRVDSREVSLTITILGKGIEDLAAKRKAFQQMLLDGVVNIQVPAMGNEVYKLIYKKSNDYARSKTGTFCKVTINFDEPNPNDRE